MRICRGRRVRFPPATRQRQARWLNPIVAGWMNYYGRYYRTGMDHLLRRVNTYLRRWAGNKYRRRLRSYRRFWRWWNGLLEREPGLFAHWKWVRAIADLRIG